ncbi:acetoacetate metabolism regulatory protein AtoC [Desulfosarcina widdelii]|uniref:Acetoacetate metabolism regulatory protein AtoC n=1 Tax=Desulfosarcina widdelii TaxID=947919 RepID=A0A5K7YY35_9BACT|nr:sigma-54 dependent transcriptional regulator [Desulfosarcina widdelii]BBO73260.1 acetoacetate metabolism regulatory protein AtoC [Desulfosarcina widdelii]
MVENQASILVVDDELSMRELLEYMLEKEGYRVICAANGKEALSRIEKDRYDLMLCDIRLGDMTGLEVLKASKKKNPHVTVIMISAFATTETAVEAMNQGAFDYVPKPFQNEELLHAIANALERKTLEREKRVIENELKSSVHFGKIVGNSARMQHIYEMIRQVARTRSSILITGESGTGKELIAKAIHEQSDRADQPFVTINCGGIPETLLESEFFGHRKGSFTGATSDKKGLMEIAHQGTLFLDEVAELSVPMQVKLLRAVQERIIRPVGGTQDIAVDIRIISATNKMLEDQVIAGNFREDLFYRLNVIEIKIPPLRDRKGDLLPLAQHFLEKYSRELGKEVTKFSSYAIDLLKKYDFPGNIRELENLIERSVALSSTNILLPDSLAMSIHKKRWIEGVRNRRFDIDEVAQGVNLDSILEEIERAYIEKAMECTDGNKNKAADLLGLSLRSFRYRVDKLNPN